MKNRRLLIAATLSSVVLLSHSIFAGSTARDAKSGSAKATPPTPLEVVHFSNLPRQYENITVRIALTIDEKGIPHDVKAAETMPRDLASRILPLIAQWRFKPSYVDGHAVSARVILPLQLVEGA